VIRVDDIVERGTVLSVTHRTTSLLAGILLSVSSLAAQTAASTRAARAADAGAVVAGPVAARIDSFMTAAAEYGMAGTLLVEKDGRVILHKGYGRVDRAKGTLATTRTPYLLGSLSKQFTAAAIYKLESQGKLRLADSLGRWFPEAPADKRGITVDQLVHHTSGLPYLPQGDLYDSLSMDSVVRETLATPLGFAPGAQYAYSSPGYSLLAALVERASGSRFDDYVRRELFHPAGMTETGFADEAPRWPATRRTPSYSSGDPEPDPPLYPAPFAARTTGGGSVVSTCADLWNWEQAIRSGRVLDPETTKKIFTPGPKVGSNASYAAGWIVARSQRNTTVFLHAGDIGGFNTDMRRLVDEHATIIFLSNTREGGRGYREIVSIMVTRILFGPEPILPPAPARVSESALRRWDGAISVAPGVTVDARVRDGAVWLTARKQEGMFALAGADSAARAQALSFNRLAETTAGQLLSGDASGLDSVISPSLVETSHVEFFRLWKAVADSIGGVTVREVLGTTISPPSGGRTLVRLTGPRGSRVMTLDWLDGHLIRSSPIPEDGLTLRFIPESANTLSRYDLWAGRVVRVARGG
jgi:CubicO group peptidase (beta-lactamase class C family)